MSDIGTVQNIVEDSSIEISNSNHISEVKVSETKTYKNPSKLSTVLVIFKTSLTQLTSFKLVVTTL